VRQAGLAAVVIDLAQSGLYDARRMTSA
jgi:hypothetical protein